MEKREQFRQEQINTIKFNEMVIRCGITNIVADLDDSLVNTTEVFLCGLENGASTLLFGQNAQTHAEAQKARQVRDELIIPTIRGLSPRFIVHPNISETALRFAARQLGIDEESDVFIKALGKVQAIYSTLRPKTFEDTHSFINALQHTNCQLILATIAGPDWTQKKLSWAKLLGKFNHVVCLDVTIPKHIQLENMLDNLDVNPQNTLFIGDSLKSDMHLVVNGQAYGAWIQRNPHFHEQLSSPDKMALIKAVNNRHLVASRNLTSAANAAASWLK